MTKIAMSTTKKLMKECGAVRVSDDAALAMAKLLTETLEDVTKRLIVLANSADRNTIREEDFTTLYAVTD